MRNLMTAYRNAGKVSVLSLCRYQVSFKPCESPQDDDDDDQTEDSPTTVSDSIKEKTLCFIL